MTIKQAREIVGELGFTLHKNIYNEYVLSGPGVEYFGGSLEDAVKTAEAITGRIVLLDV